MQRESELMLPGLRNRADGASTKISIIPGSAHHHVCLSAHGLPDHEFHRRSSVSGHHIEGDLNPAGDNDRRARNDWGHTHITHRMPNPAVAG